MPVTIEYDSVRVPKRLKARRAVALPLYTISLILSFLVMPPETLLGLSPATDGPDSRLLSPASPPVQVWLARSGKQAGIWK